MAPPRFSGDSPEWRARQPLPPEMAARLRRELGEPLYALLAEAELLVRDGAEEDDPGKSAAGERILCLGRQLAGTLRELR